MLYHSHHATHSYVWLPLITGRIDTEQQSVFSLFKGPLSVYHPTGRQHVGPIKIKFGILYLASQLNFPALSEGSKCRGPEKLQTRSNLQLMAIYSQWQQDTVYWATRYSAQIKVNMTSKSKPRVHLYYLTIMICRHSASLQCLRFLVLEMQIYYKNQTEY